MSEEVHNRAERRRMSSHVDPTLKWDEDEEKVTNHIFNMADYSIFTSDLSIFHLAHNLTTISNVVRVSE